MKNRRRVIFIVLALMVLILSAGCGKPIPINEKNNPDETAVPTKIQTDIFTEFPPTLTPTIEPTRIQGKVLPVRCLYVSFDKRGNPSGYYSGEVISNFNDFDPMVGHTVKEEISLQLDEIAKLGVNAIAFELRSSDPNYIAEPFSPPDCNIPPSLGLQYPQPTQKEITNLVDFFDLLQSKGMKVYLRLVNTHMEEQPPSNNALWLSAILSAIKDKPALALVLFEGDIHATDSNKDGISDYCGMPAEPPLWDGSNSVPAEYIKWAIANAHTLGLPYEKLSAEAVIGDFSATQPEISGYHNTVQTLKEIFNAVGIPEEQRTYAISLYERPKCAYSRIPCEEEQLHLWATQTFDNLFQVLGKDTKAKIVFVEMGLMTNIVKFKNHTYYNEPVSYDHWNHGTALESLVWLMEKYGVDGGCFWSWANTSSEEDLDPVYGEQVKKRGVEFLYNPVKDVLENLYTYGEMEPLNSTSDKEPPTFKSVRIEPATIENGKEIMLSANMGEPYIFVLADLSDLDSSQIEPLTLINDGKGIYSVSTSVSWWNEAQNGSKIIKLWAMDFWGNTTETSVNVELNNPPPEKDNTPPDDLFDGNKLSPKKWNEELNGGTIAVKDQLELSVPQISGTPGPRVVSQWSFIGDFDAQVDFRIGSGWSAPKKEHLDGATFGIQINGAVYHITRLRNQGEDIFFTWSNQDNPTTKFSSSVTEGKLRLIRKSDVLYLLFNEGSGWKFLDQRKISTAPAQVYLDIASVNAEQAFATTFDNFIVNSGLTNYLP